MAEKHGMSVTYIIFSKMKRHFYVGSSRLNDTEKRLKAHNAGRVRSTKLGRPWVEVAVEVFDSYTEARKREIFLKSGVGRKWISNRYGHYKQS